MIAKAAVLSVVAMLLVCTQAHAQQQLQVRGTVTSNAAPVMLVVDTSGSMGEDDDRGGQKIEGAKLALLDYLDGVDTGAAMGLLTYPESGGCDNGQVRIGIDTVDTERMSRTIRQLTPDGDTPTAEALRHAGEILEPYQRGTIVLVSDGESTCDDPCEAARELAGQGIELDAITVGFRISEEGREELRCIAEALDGRYLDVEQGDELRETLDGLSRPALEVSLASDIVRAVAGGAYVDVPATITNAGNVEARGVVAQLSVEEGGVDVRKPVTHLGNLAPGAKAPVTWRLRVDGERLIGKTPNFQVVARALNADRSAVADGEIFVEGVDRAEDAGPILKGSGKIAILGDSYSAGEGADLYDRGTDTNDNGCHRSSKTYLATAYPRDFSVLACSGAVAEHLIAPGDYGETSQLQKLAELQGGDDAPKPARAVVMTMGGNDAEFGPLASSCILTAEDCSKAVYRSLYNPLSRTSRATFDEEGLFGLESTLAARYRDVHATLNSPKAVKRRKGVAPILILAYPIPVPLAGRACAPMGFSYQVRSAVKVDVGKRDVDVRAPIKTTYWLNATEIFSLATFAIRLNGRVETAVRNARADGVPVFYIPVTEMAFQPRHTVCDGGRSGSATEAWARAINSYNLAGLNMEQLASLVPVGTPPWDVPKLRAAIARRAGAAGVTAAKRGVAELAHPNQKGYLAQTREILRWSRSRDAEKALAFVRSAEAAKAAPTEWKLSEVDLGQLQPGQPVQVQGGTSYGLTLQGFAPATDVRLEVRSEVRVLGHPEVGADGTLRAQVPIPKDLPGGAHTVVVTGAGADGKPKVVKIPVEVDAPLQLTFVRAALGGSALTFVLGLVALGMGALLRRRSTRNAR